MESKILELAKLIEFNEKAEAQAIFDYTDLLKQAFDLQVDGATYNQIAGVIAEIISDELNHQEKLKTLYTFLTGIEPNKD